MLTLDAVLSFLYGSIVFDLPSRFILCVFSRNKVLCSSFDCRLITVPFPKLFFRLFNSFFPLSLLLFILGFFLPILGFLLPSSILCPANLSLGLPLLRRCA